MGAPGSTTVQDWLAGRAGEVALGPAASRVVDILATQPHLASYASTADLAERAAVNVATVVRTARQLGFSGWPQLRLELRNRYLASLSAPQVLAEHGDNPSNPAAEAIQRDMESLALLARTVDMEAIRAIAGAITAASRTVVIGSGTFAAPGVQLAHASTSMGMDVLLERHFGTQLANTVTRLTKQDCLLAVNLWWLPKEVLEASRIAREQGVTTCAITDLGSSPLAEVSDHVIIVPSEGVSSFPSLTPAMAVVHGILAELTVLAGPECQRAMERTEAAWARMRLFH
ncbi:RpiR family transcriptional regulator [Tamaricihabitans halophyticus]|uniref:RpiR family transcriptional regulator n=1 Tax=Tamaricihabitans halophyticus TaxID=1262583 RepID=A0A4R2QYL5_9PSEU|nr:MurR/RpiR family transcriptional regulator [Tamaricihabitans halophyticus]TCP54299.1 RpiR family transcriptional regulator [Tamaricihabitans halophyticus]